MRRSTPTRGSPPHYEDSGKPAPAQAFATLIEGMDKSLGDLLDHLDALGVAENTLVLFLGDNGTDAPLGDPHEVACAAPLRGKKGSHYEGGMRVPFIAAWAKANAANPAPEAPADRRRRHPEPAGRGLRPVSHDPRARRHRNRRQSHVVDGARLDTLLAGKPRPVAARKSS